MKVLRLVIAVFLLATVAAAQAHSGLKTDAPGVAVVEKKWQKRERPRALIADLSSDHEKNIEYERSMRETLYENQVRVKAGERPLRLPTPPRTSPATTGERPTLEYIYEVKVVNTGKKKIKGLVWGYVLFDSDKGREVGHQRFTSEVSIDPGKSKTLVGHSLFSPARVVDVTQAGEERPGQYTERVVIHRIEYKDDSVWERSSR